MDKSCQSSGDSTTANSSSSSTNGRDDYLKHLNKLSHKISKPTSIRKPLPFDHSLHQNPNFDQNQNLNQPQLQQQPQQNLQTQPHQHQPPVYNINKNDFRDVVQRLTGSPVHERFSSPPPIHPPKPPSSRLQRIRPPPLTQVSNRPPPLLNHPSNPPLQPPSRSEHLINPIPNTAKHFGTIGRAVAPLSPLPPLPTVHAPAESPVSAYMRYLHNSIPTIDSNPKQQSGFSPQAPLASPRWNNLAPPQHQQLPTPQQQDITHPPPTSAMMPTYPQFPMPSSPLPFGCLNSPRSPYALFSPSLLLSPSSGQFGFPQLPLSPTVPLPSPRWRGH